MAEEDLECNVVRMRRSVAHEISCFVVWHGNRAGWPLDQDRVRVSDVRRLSPKATARLTPPHGYHVLIMDGNRSNVSAA